MSTVCRAFFGLGIAIAILVCGATSAGALTVRPTDWKSSVTSISPNNENISIDVIEGGEALRLTAQPGHRVGILGYQGEPYLRLTDDGRVQANLRSPTWWANLDGTGTGRVPDDATPEAEPEWSTIATGDSVLWHDHRTHAMQGVTEERDWTLLLSVDDQPIEVRGRLSRLPSHSPLPEFVLAVVCAAIVVALGFKQAWSASLGATMVASALALLVAVGSWTATPSGFSHPLPTVLTALASVALALVSVILRHSTRRRRLLATSATLAFLAWWVALMYPAITSAFVPSSLPEVVVRLSIALVAGAVVGVAIVVIITGGFTDLAQPGQADAADRTDVSA